MVCRNVGMWTRPSLTRVSTDPVGSTFDLKADGKPVICYYNGYIGSEDMPMPAGRTGGAKKLGIQNIAEHPMQGRAVLFDLEKHFGLGCIAGMKEIKQIIEKDKIVIKSGDFAVFHTGAGKVLMDAQGDITPEKWKNVTECGLDGRDPELLQWVTDSGFVALISDNVGLRASVLMGSLRSLIGGEARS